MAPKSLGRQLKWNTWKQTMFNAHKERTNAENYVKQNVSRHVSDILAKFHSESVPIRIKTGNFEKVPLEEWYGDFCNENDIEDEKHVLHCELCNDLW